MRVDKRERSPSASTLQKKLGHAYAVFGTYLETMVMSLAEYKRLDVCILGFVRKLVRGTATSKTVTDAGTKYRTLKSNGNG